jgi:hypothetical protein
MSPPRRNRVWPPPPPPPRLSPPTTTITCSFRPAIGVLSVNPASSRSVVPGTSEDGRTESGVSACVRARGPGAACTASRRATTATAAPLLASRRDHPCSAAAGPHPWAHLTVILAVCEPGDGRARGKEPRALANKRRGLRVVVPQLRQVPLHGEAFRKPVKSVERPRSSQPLRQGAGDSGRSARARASRAPYLSAIQSSTQGTWTAL